MPFAVLEVFTTSSMRYMSLDAPPPPGPVSPDFRPGVVVQGRTVQEALDLMEANGWELHSVTSTVVGEGVSSAGWKALRGLYVFRFHHGR